ncbi:MAG: hypothetical protein KJ709_00160 [Nanoarchaeota archaeon]|nr:hypothetical protein [Nanoarchaeota archaeon]
MPKKSTRKKEATPLQMKELREIRRRLKKAGSQDMVTGCVMNSYQMSLKFMIEDKDYDAKFLKKVKSFILDMEEAKRARSGRPRGRPLSDFL